MQHLRALDAGNGEQIPLLSEVFDLCKGKVNINVELKGPNTAAPVVAFLEQQCQSGWTPDQLLLSSFDHDQLLAAKAMNPVFARAGLYYAEDPNFDFLVNTLEAVAVNPWVDDVTPDLVDAAHAAGLQVLVYTVNDPVDISWMRTCKVDGIFSNYPERV